MHIEPGLVDGTKIVLSYATGGAALLYTAKLCLESTRVRSPLSIVVAGSRIARACDSAARAPSRLA